jgi:SAM-dependent methyltransferase
MDERTARFYASHASPISDSYDQMEPESLYTLADVYFNPAGTTLDIGCGSGRDLRRFAEKGYRDLTGADGSPEMLTEAKKRSEKTTIRFYQDTLPAIKATEGSDLFDNVLASGVIMHLPEHDLVEAAINLLRITKPNGVILLSFRPPRDAISTDPREDDGRLFTPIHPKQLALLFETLGATTLHTHESAPTADGKTWITFVIQKQDPSRQGLRLSQSIIIEEQKSSTYKLALLIAIIHVARNRSKAALWDKDKVLIPLRLLAQRWLELYWHMIKAKIKNGTAEKLAFQSQIEALSAAYPLEPFDLDAHYDDLTGSVQRLYDGAVRAIAKTIVDQPARYAGSNQGHYSVFAKATSAAQEKTPEPLGYLSLSADLWRDFTVFSHWVEPRILFEWHAKLQSWNQNSDQLWQTLLKGLESAKRSTTDIHLLYKDQKPFCVWSGRELSQFEVDHLLPFSALRNNDLWNLMPASKAMNASKSDLVPSAETLMRAKARIFVQWREYSRKWPRRFWREISLALANHLDEEAGEERCFNLAFKGLIELAERTAFALGTARWSPEESAYSTAPAIPLAAEPTKPYRSESND